MTLKNPNELVTFEQWLKTEGITGDLELFKRCWNQAISTSADYVGYYEGTDFGLVEKYSVEEKTND